MHAFFLGSHPEISAFEVMSQLSGKTVTLLLPDAIIVDTTDEEAINLYSCLGGSPKMGRVIATIPFGDQFDVVQKVVAALAEALKTVEKPKYVLSFYGDAARPKAFEKKAMHRLLEELLPKAKYNGPFWGPTHAPAAVFHVIKRGGAEFSILAKAGVWYIVQTIQAQDARFWTVIDFERPSRDMSVGMLPAKLARIMINLSRAQKGDYIWDPFVGQGTIPMLAGPLGINVYGSDLQTSNISLAKKNLAWMRTKGIVGNFQTTFWGADIREESDVFAPHFSDTGISGIVTEPFLGSNLRKPFGTDREADRAWRMLSPLYDSLLARAMDFLPVGKRLVFVKPLYQFVDKRSIQWYNPELRIDSRMWRDIGRATALGMLRWIQPNTFVAREIVVLEKVR